MRDASQDLPTGQEQHLTMRQRLRQMGIGGLEQPALLVERFQSTDMFVIGGNDAAADMFERDRDQVAYQMLDNLVGPAAADSLAELAIEATPTAHSEVSCLWRGRWRTNEVTVLEIERFDTETALYLIVFADPGARMVAPAGSVPELLGGAAEVAISADRDGRIRYVCGHHPSAGLNPKFLEGQYLTDVFENVVFDELQQITLDFGGTKQRLRVVMTECSGGTYVYSRMDLTGDPDHVTAA